MGGSHSDFRKSPVLQQKALTYCKTVANVINAAEPAQAGKVYLDAAKDALYQMMFLFRHDLSGTVQVTNAMITEFGNTKQQAERFLHKYGNSWLFCRCRPHLLYRCLHMDDINKQAQRYVPL